MIWATNYDRLACFTLFSMFFGGRDFAPKCIIDGVNIQDYLTSHYVEAFGKLADKIRDAGDLLDECVIGWDSLNEPSAGFIGHENLNDFLSDQAMKKGTRPTPAQSLRLGMGMAQTVETWGFNQFGPKLEGSVTVDPHGVRAWMNPDDEPNRRSTRWGWKRGKEWKLGTCPWALHDVWDPESGYILIPDYFKSPPSETSRDVNFIEDYWRPHWRAYFERVRSSHPEAIPFIQPPVFVRPPQLNEGELRGRGCYSPHYYDGLTLITRHWNWFNADALGVLRGKYASPVLAVKFGEWAIRKSLQEQLGEYLKDVSITFGEYPTMMGEIGTPMDMDQKRSYSGAHAGDYTNQQKAMDASLNGCDGPNSLNYTIWTYCPDNSHEWGENWNLEDLSLYSADDLHGPEINTRYRMGSMGTAGLSTDTINDRSNAQLLLTRASSVNIDRVEFPTQNPSYPQLPNANPSMSSIDTLDPPARAVERHSRSSALRRMTEMETEAVSVANTSSSSGAEADTLYRFLTNGARAVGAFNRPWPIATVGTPTDIQFNIAKAEFKLTVHVSAEDIAAATIAPPSSPSMSSQQHRRRRSDDTASREKEEVIATEIFLPLVHFAEDPFARRAPTSVYSQTTPTQTQPLSRPSDSSTFPLRSAPPQLPEQSFDNSPFVYDIRHNSHVSSSSPVPLPSPSPSPTSMSMPMSSTAGGLRASMLSNPVSEEIAASGRGDALSPAWTTWGGYDVPLALEIEASEGSRWEVEGQVLKWWYPGPALAGGMANGEDGVSGEKLAADGSAERWIRVRRKGGAIKGIGTKNIRVEKESSSIWDLCPKWI